MADPWDPPPLPSRGDDDDDATYAGVGRVMSRWEAVEIELAHLYTVLVGRPHDAGATREYGSGRIFHERLATLCAAAEDYFRIDPNQTREGETRELLRKVRGYSDRRNEIAHGIVRQISWVRGLREYLSPDAIGHIQFCLVPPHYTFRKFDQANRPAYAYTSQELLILEQHLFDLAEEVQAFRLTLDPEDE